MTGPMPTVTGGHPFFLSSFSSLLLPPYPLPSSLGQWHDQPPSADRTSSDAAPVPIGATARGPIMARRRVRRRARTDATAKSAPTADEGRPMTLFLPSSAASSGWASTIDAVEVLGAVMRGADKRCTRSLSFFFPGLQHDQPNPIRHRPGADGGCFLRLRPSEPMGMALDPNQGES